MTSPSPDPGAAPARAWSTAVGASIASGVLLALAFPPFDLGLLALVALVPLLWAWRDTGPARAGALGFVAGLAFFGLLLSWVWYFGAVAIFPLLIALAAYWAAVGAIVGGLARLGLRSPWLVAAAWVVLEALRDRWPLGGFAWGEAGVALHSLSAARALASWGGVPLVTFLVVAANALLLDLGHALARREPGALALVAGGLAAIVIATSAGVALRFEPTPTGQLHFALLQGNDQNRRLTPDEQAGQFLTRRHLALAATLHGSYDLIVFPESALDTDPEADPVVKAKLGAIGREHGSALLVNGIADGPDGSAFNTNRLYDPGGRLQGSYAKQHLVPYGEYVPFRDELGFVRELEQIPRDYRPGHEARVFHVAGHPIGTVICFESAFGPLVREFAAKGAQAIVVSTNNRSFRRSANAAQHLALSQMRAAELARPVLHASISGITGVIDASGRVRRTTSLFKNAVVIGRITTETGRTPYVRYGDWAVWGSAAALASTLAGGFARRRLRAATGPMPDRPTPDRSAT